MDNTEYRNHLAGTLARTIGELKRIGAIDEIISQFCEAVTLDEILGAAKIAAIPGEKPVPIETFKLIAADAIAALCLLRDAGAQLSPSLIDTVEELVTEHVSRTVGLGDVADTLEETAA